MLDPSILLQVVVVCSFSLFSNLSVQPVCRVLEGPSSLSESTQTTHRMWLSKDQRSVSPFKNPLVHPYLQLQPPVYCNLFPFHVCVSFVLQRELWVPFSLIDFFFLCKFYLFGCVGSQWQHEGPLLHHVRSFVPASPGSLVAARGLSCFTACGTLVLLSRIEPLSSALQGRYLTSGPPGKSLDFLIWWIPCVRHISFHLWTLPCGDALLTLLRLSFLRPVPPRGIAPQCSQSPPSHAGRPLGWMWIVSQSVLWYPAGHPLCGHLLSSALPRAVGLDHLGMGEGLSRFLSFTLMFLAVGFFLSFFLFSSNILHILLVWGLIFSLILESL